MLQEVRKVKRVSIIKSIITVKNESSFCKLLDLNQVEVVEIAILRFQLFSLICISYIINAFLLIYQLGTCCVYVVFISSNIKGIVDLYTEEKVDVRLIMVFILLPLIFLNWVCSSLTRITKKH